VVRAYSDLHCGLCNQHPPAIAGIVSKGPTACNPVQTAFFQTLQIWTKNARGQPKMTTITHFIKKDDWINASNLHLLTKLSIKPFTY
jgi:large subunit ribosomal protein LP0